MASCCLMHCSSLVRTCGSRPCVGRARATGGVWTASVVRLGRPVCFATKCLLVELAADENSTGTSSGGV
eukprot:scaffold201_cov405-Prasinococcus_capsulatus_cf.AAC.18